MEGRIPLINYIFSKEVKFGHYKNENQLPPAALIAKKMMKEDEMFNVKYGERIQYVVIAGHQKKLIDLIVTPRQFLASSHLKLNTNYYITKQVLPSIHRLFKLVSIDVFKWFSSMEKPSYFRPCIPDPLRPQKFTLTQYFVRQRCIVCFSSYLSNNSIDSYVCDSCYLDKQSSIYLLMLRLSKNEESLQGVVFLCQQCSKFNLIDCISLDCPFFYERLKLNFNVKYDRDLIKFLDWFLLFFIVFNLIKIFEFIDQINETYNTNWFRRIVYHKQSMCMVLNKKLNHVVIRVFLCDRNAIVRAVHSHFFIFEELMESRTQFIEYLVW